MVDFIQKAKDILLRSTVFFKNLKRETGVQEAFVYFAVLSAVGTVLGFLVGAMFEYSWIAAFPGLFGESAQQLPTLPVLFGFTVVGYFLGLGLSFVLAAILHVWLMIFGGRAAYEKTYQLYAYCLTPNFVLGWIPFIGSFAWIYSLVLFILGTQVTHGLSKNRAILAYVLPVVALIILALFLVLLFIVAFAGILASGVSSVRL